MNFLNRAIKNVTRGKSKSILLILTFFLIGNLVIIGLGVSEASESAKILTRQKMRAVVTYELDYDAINEYTMSIEDEDELNDFYSKYYPKISIDDVKDLLKDERVKTANSITTNMVYDYDSSFTYVHLGNKAEEYMDEENEQLSYVDGEAVSMAYVNPKFLIKGNYFPDMIELTDGEYTITQGRFYTKEELDNSSPVCLITSELASYNGVGLGDKIKIMVASKSDIASYNGAGITEEDITAELEVIGIYDHKLQITPDNQNFDYTYPYENPSNIILMPATSYNEINKTFSDKLNAYYSEMYGMEEDELNNSAAFIGNATILLNDPLLVDDFVNDYKDGLAKFTILDANNKEFEKLSKPLDTLSLYANFIVWLVVINAIVVISLVTALTLKTREYEIGVLLSIGATKLKVITQFFVELALVAIIGFSLSIVSGSLIAGKVGETVLEYQIQSSDISEDDHPFDDYINIWDEDYSTDISLDDLISEYSVTVSPLIIMEIYVLGLGIVLISVIIPSFMIMRYNPKKILMNQG